MDRHFHGEPDDDDNDFEGEDMENFVKASKQDIMDVMHIELAEQELNERLLFQAKNIASSDFLWVFRDVKYKMKTIEKIYKKLKKMSADEIE